MSNITSNFYTSAEWESGFTGKLDVVNKSENLDGWTVEFEAPFEITEVWDAKIIRHEGNKYVLGNLDYNQNLASGETQTITFNANKVKGEVAAPEYLSLVGAINEPIASENTSSSSPPLDFYTSAEWESGFTGKLDVVNKSENLDGWTVEFEAPFEITEVWDAKIIRHEGNKYVLGNLDYNQDLASGETQTITFNANKVKGEIAAPEHYLLSSNDVASENTEETEATKPNIEPAPNVNLTGETSGLSQLKPMEELFTETETFEPSSNESGNGQFKYGEALQKSLLFFEANRSGDLPNDNRIEWRDDSAMNDGADVGRDLTGGYYDSGDHVKFGLPMSASNTMLAWGGIEYKEAYKQSGQWDELLDAVKWGTDYFLKAHVSEEGKTKELYVQVGDGNADHQFWGSPEDMKMERPAFKIDALNPGSDVAAGTASALASASLLFQGVDDAYADKLLTNAKQLFEFADTYRGKYSDSVPQASPFYTSSGYADELAEGAAWLYKATGEQKYLERAEEIYDNNIGGPGDWTWAYDDKAYSTLLLLAQESDDPKYQQKFESWASNWVEGKGNVKHTSGGLAWRTEWGSLSLSSASAFMIGLYSDTVKSKSSYQNFAIGQVNYILGDNPRNSSYMVGFGQNHPKQPHHRGAAGSSPYGKANEHILYGAMVGGPGSTDDFDYNDDRNDWITNEVATGYNAPITNALIQAYDDFGGEPLTEQQLDSLTGIDGSNA